MSKKDWVGIAYVSAWIVIWGTFGSLVDYPLLENKIYNPGSLGQFTSFTITAAISTIVGIILFPFVTSKLDK